MRAHRSRDALLWLVRFLERTKHEKMVRACKFPNCNNKMKSYMHCSFHRLPLRVNGEILKLWLAALQIDPNTSIAELRKADYRVCSDHFHRDDYYHDQDSSKTPKAYFLKPTAVPRVVNPEEGAQMPVELMFAGVTMDTLLQPSMGLSGSDEMDDMGEAGQVSSTGMEEAEETATMEKDPALQHVVDVEAILQLMKNCPMCGGQCRAHKLPLYGPYFRVYQSCYFCNYNRKWVNQPEAKNMKPVKATKCPKRKKPSQVSKVKVSVNTKGHHYAAGDA